MTVHQEGGCLCGRVRYSVKDDPLHVTICHCTFCQRATGTAFLIEPIFQASDFRILAGQPKTFTQTSASSGKDLTVKFCADCGTKLFNKLERSPDVVPVYGGTFDDPNWFDRSPKVARHIFAAYAQKGTLLPADHEVYAERAVLNDGTKATPTIYDAPHQVR